MNVGPPLAAAGSSSISMTSTHWEDSSPDRAGVVVVVGAAVGVGWTHGAGLGSEAGVVGGADGACTVDSVGAAFGAGAISAADVGSTAGITGGAGGACIVESIGTKIDADSGDRLVELLEGDAG